MILPNVQKYEFLEIPTDNFRALHIAVVNGNILLCPKLGSIYTWWLPKTSPQNGFGGWSKLKHIDTPNKVSLWDKDAQQHITEIVDNHLNCYLVPMKDISYSCREADGVNFNIYIKANGVFYSTNVVDKADGLTVVSISKDYKGTLYSLEDNSVVYENLEPNQTSQTTLDSWMTVDEGWEWNQVDNLIYPEDTPGTPMNIGTPKTPPKTPPNAPPCQKNLMDEFDNEALVTKQTMDLLESDEESSEESVMELTSGSSSDSDDLDDDLDLEDELELEDDLDLEDALDLDLEDDSDSDSNYEPSEQSDSTIASEGKHDYDELRQDLDGSWNTRRQFYDYYGSDDSWDNQDPNVFLAKRRDERDGKWYTKEQFFQFYGSYVIWKKMAPKKQLMRQTIYEVYQDAQRLPERLQDNFIYKILATY